MRRVTADPGTLEACSPRGFARATDGRQLHQARARPRNSRRLTCPGVGGAPGPQCSPSRVAAARSRVSPQPAPHLSRRRAPPRALDGLRMERTPGVVRPPHRRAAARGHGSRHTRCARTAGSRPPRLGVMTSQGRQASPGARWWSHHCVALVWAGTPTGPGAGGRPGRGRGTQEGKEAGLVGSGVSEVTRRQDPPPLSDLQPLPFEGSADPQWPRRPRGSPHSPEVFPKGSHSERLRTPLVA